MNRRFATGTIAALLAVTVPSAGAVAATETAQSATPAAPPPATVTPAAPPTAPPGQPGKPIAVPLPEPKITAAEAEAAVKALFKLPQPSEKLELEWRLSQLGNKRTWELEVTIREANSSMGFGLATVDAMTGRVLRYGGYANMPGPVRTGPVSAARTADEAKARAWALVQKMAPEKADTLELAPGSSTSQFQQYYYGYGPGDMGDAYRFTWVEYHDGVPFPASSVSVAVDKQSLDYISLNVNLLDGIKFQAGPAKVTADAAVKFWQSEAKPALTYQPLVNGYPYGISKATGYKLVYTLGNLTRMVDATTGTWVKDASPYPTPDAGAKPGAEPEAVPAGSVTPVVPKALPLSDSDAQNLARAVLEASQDANIQSTHDMFRGPERLLQFHLFNPGSSASVEIEPKTGLIRNAYRSRNMQPTGPNGGGEAEEKVTPALEAEAKQAAFAVVQTYYSQLRDQVRFDPAPEFIGPQDDQTRRFHFSRFVNGISVPNEAIYVTIDLGTMTWRDMSAGWTSGTNFPSPAAAIGPENAQLAAMAERKPMLLYRPVFPAMNKEQMGYGPMPRPTEAVLAYTLTPALAAQVDALTGQPVGYDGRPESDRDAAYKQLTGHPAENELRFVLAQRVLSPDQLKPNAPLTRAQAVMMLLARNPRMSHMPAPVELPYTDLSDTDAAYGAIGLAWSEGWLRPSDSGNAFGSDAPITRAGFAVWAARALGLGDLARTRLTVDAGYKDLGEASVEQRNAISFLRALELLPADDSFRPTQAITQAEGAALTVRIYNYLLTR